MDGTFGTVAFPFYQILITRTKVVNRPFTTSFSLLPNKKKTTYESAIHQIKETVTREGYMWDPSTVHVDCEVGLYKAVRRVFPGIDTKLCWINSHFRRSAKDEGKTWTSSAYSAKQELEMVDC